MPKTMNLADFTLNPLLPFRQNVSSLTLKGNCIWTQNQVFFGQQPILLARHRPLLSLWSLFSPFLGNYSVVIFMRSSQRGGGGAYPSCWPNPQRSIWQAPFYLNFWKKVTSPNDQDGWRSCLLHGQSVMRGQNLVELGWDSRNQALWPSSQGGLQTCSPDTFQSFSNNLN